MENSLDINFLSSLSTDDLTSLQNWIEELKKQKKLESKEVPTISEYGKIYNHKFSTTFSKSYLRSIDLTFKHATSFWGTDTKLTKLTVRDFEDFKIDLMKHAPKAYKIFLRTLSAALNVAVEWGYLIENPLLKIKFPKRQQVKTDYLTREELDKILKHTFSQIMQNIIQFGFFTGCRLNEILSLMWNDVDISKKMITVGSENFTTKNRLSRIIPMSKIVFEIILQQRRISRESDKVIFCKPNGFRYNRDYVSRKFKKAIRQAGLRESISFHMLRHSFASELVSLGVPINTLQSLLGHQSIVSTQVYLHANKDQLINAINRLDAA